MLYTRKIQEYAAYKDKCIQNGILNQSLAGNVLLSTFNSNTNKFEFVWISRSPANTTLADLYNFMSQVHSNIEKELCKLDKKLTTFDCHLCLYVRGQSGTFKWMSLNIFGSYHTSQTKYCSMLFVKPNTLLKRN